MLNRINNNFILLHILGMQNYKKYPKNENQKSKIEPKMCILYFFYKKCTRALAYMKNYL